MTTKGHCESSLGSFDECSEQAAVDPQTKPPDLGCESACRQLSSTTTIAIYLTFFNLPRPATAATASRLRSQKLHIVLWGLHVGLVL